MIKSFLSKLFHKTPQWKTFDIKAPQPGKIKIGVAFYYKDIEQYPEMWVNKCIGSMRNQTYQDFEVFVLNYGKYENNSYNFDMGTRSYYIHKQMNNYADAMNFVYSKIFETCDIAVNTNIDDYYSPNRIEFLLRDLGAGADIASANVRIIDRKNIATYSPVYHNMNIAWQLNNGFNPVSNPCHLMKKRVFEKLQFDSKLVPVEDMEYWKKAIEAGFKITINRAYLHYYRMHQGQSTHKK